MIKVEFELKGLKEAKELFSKKAIEKAVRSALSKAVTSVRVEAVKQITSQYDIKKGDVEPYVKVGKRPSYSDLSAELSISGKKIQMIYFRGRQGPMGSLFNIKKGSITYIPHAFIQTMSGHRGAWLRGKYTKAAVKPKTPVLLRGPSVSALMGQEKIINSLREKFFERMNIEFPRAIDAITKGYL